MMAAVACLCACVTAGLEGWSAASDTQTPRGFRAFRDPAGRFTLDYPQDWQLIPGARNLLLTVGRKDLKAMVVVEQQHMLNPAAEITDLTLSLEVDELKRRQPDAGDVAASISKDRARTMVLDYTRPGVRGPERLRQYSFQEGSVLLRVTCIAPAEEFLKHLVPFVTIVNSVRVLRTSAPEHLGGND
jgi:hypothetical protein